MIGGPGWKKGPMPSKEDMGEEDGGEEKPGPSLGGMGRRREARNILAAIKNDDASALDEALEAHYSACAAKDE